MGRRILSYVIYGGRNMKVVTENHYVPAKHYTTTKYIASDGREFFTEDDCVRHEKYIEINNHPVFKNCITNILTLDEDYNVSLYYIRNQDDYDFLIDNTGISKRDYIFSDFKQHGEGWYVFYNDGLDYHDNFYIYNYNVYVKKMENELKSWQENIQSKINNKVIEL